MKRLIPNNNLLDEVQIFTDGSRINGGVGAAATLYREGKEVRSLHKHLGPEEHHTVFEAELVGILMGMHLALEEKSEHGITICVDNQAAISTTTMAKQMAGQYLVKATQDILTCATKQHRDCDITLRWIPGHKGIEGNERADDEAKLAANGKSSSLTDLPQLLKKMLPISKTALSQTKKAQIALESHETHLASKRIDRIREIDPRLCHPEAMPNSLSPFREDMQQY